MTKTNQERSNMSLDDRIDEIDELIIEAEFDEARAAIDAAIKDFDNTQELMILRAEVALESARYSDCVETVDEALENIEDDELRGQLFELRGYAQFYLDDLEAARQTFNEAVRVGGASWEALVGRAMVHEDLLYFRAALLDLDRAISIDDQEVQPFAIRGSIHLRQGNLDDAEGDLAHAISLDPGDEESRLNLARIQATGRRTSAAIETLEPLVEEGLDPEFVMPAALLRSQLSLTLGSTEAAAEDAEAAIDIAPDEPWGYMQLAACRITGRKAGDAVAALKEAEKRVDDLRDIPDVYSLKASAYEQLGKADKAKKMRDSAEGTARLPGIVYGEWLNPAANAPLNPNKPIDARALMGQIFDDPAQAPEGYEDALRDVIDQIPQMIQDNPQANKIRIQLPEIEGSEDAPKSLVLQVNQPTNGQQSPPNQGPSNA